MLAPAELGGSFKLPDPGVTLVQLLITLHRYWLLLVPLPHGGQNLVSPYSQHQATHQRDISVIVERKQARVECSNCGPAQPCPGVCLLGVGMEGAWL